MAPAIGVGVGLAFALGISNAPAGANTLAFLFGANTRANASAVAPSDASFGATGLSPINASIVDADPVNPSHWAVVGGYKLAPTINGGLAASYTLKVSYDGVVYDVTINTQAATCSVASVAEFNAVAALAAAAPTTDLTVLFRSSTYGLLAVSNIAMSGTLSGVPAAPACFEQDDTHRNQTWTPTFTGGKLVIGSHKPYGAKFSGASTLANSTGIDYRDIVMGRLSPTPQYSYEPESSVGAVVTGITLGFPTIVSLNTSSGTVVGAKCRVAGITTGPLPMNGVHVTVLAVNGNDVTVDFDSTGMTAWSAGGNWQGAVSINYLPAFTPSGVNSTFIFNGTRFSGKDLNPDAAYWTDMIVVGTYKSAVYYNCTWDGFQNGLMIGRGWQTWCKNLHFRNNIADNIQIGAATTTAPATHTAIAKDITAVTNAAIGVVTCPNHGLSVGDSFVVTAATGMTQINTTPRMVYAVIDANTFQLAHLPTTGPDVSLPTDTTAWGVYAGGGKLNGPLFCKMFMENIYEGPQADDDRFTTLHSDGIQSGSPGNEVGFKGNFFDIVINMITRTISTITTQGFFGAGAETDATAKRYLVKNILTRTTTINGVSAPTTEDWRSEMSYVTAIHHPTVATPALGATYRQPPKRMFGKSIICGDYINNGGGVMTHAKTNVIPATDLNTVFDGDFAPDGRGYYLDTEPEPTGTVPEILQAFANRYKGIGVCDNMGFGADPNSWLFNGSVNNTPAVISGVGVVPTTSAAQVNWSCDVGSGFVYWALSTSNALTQADVIGAAMNGHATLVGANRGVVGMTATGAQPALACGGLAPATTYYAYLVVERLHGVKTFSGPVTVTTNALAGTIQYLGEVIRNGATAGNITLSGLSLQQDDLLVVFDTASSNATSRTVGVSTAGYTNVAAKISANDTYDSNSIIQWKLMGAVPDTTVGMLSTGNGTDARKTVVRAYRFNDLTTTIDVAPVTITPANTFLPDLGAITPVTPDALIICFGAGASVNGNTTAYNAPSDLTDWTSQTLSTAAFNVTIGIGHKLWSSGTFNPEAWTGPSSAATDSVTGWTIALRPNP